MYKRFQASLNQLILHQISIYSTLKNSFHYLKMSRLQSYYTCNYKEDAPATPLNNVQEKVLGKCLEKIRSFFSSKIVL